MSNLTFEERLLRDHPAEPLEGHNVVVFERMGAAGDRFLTTLPPGTPLKRGLLDLVRQSRYFGVAVDASPELHLDVRGHVVLEDEEAHRCELLLDLYYSVSDPRLLAGHRNRDPLGLVAERARQLVGRDVSKLRWTEVVYTFAATAQELLRHRLPELKALAAKYGIALESVEAGRLLPVEYTEPAQETEAALDRISRGERVGMATLDAARRLDDAGNLHTLGAAQMDAAAQDVRDAAAVRAAEVGGRARAIESVTAGISTPGDYRAVFPGEIQTGGAPGATTGMLARPGHGRDAALLPATGGLLALLHRVVGATANVGESGKRLQLRSALLHLVAEVLLEELAEPADRTRYADAARDLSASLDGSLVPHQLDTLRALADPAELEKALRG